MGILNGNKICRKFSPGLYNSIVNSQTDNSLPLSNESESLVYEIIIDGEYTWHTGLIAENLTHNNASMMIVNTAMVYQNNRMIAPIVAHQKCLPKRVIVYMDGARINNKCNRPEGFSFNVGVIRNLYIQMCLAEGYEVRTLDRGESELQMYLRRDQNINLSIFVTSDTDFLSIVYGHEPLINGKRHKVMDFSEIVMQHDVYCVGKHDSHNSATTELIDTNFVYCKPSEVKDSVAWLNITRDMFLLLGMDNTFCHLNLNTMVFRTFVALCGTDFTNHILTASMIERLIADNDGLKANSEYLNSLTDEFEILIAILILAYKLKGTPVRKQKCTDFTLVNRNVITFNLKSYNDYIECGKMTTQTIVRSPMGWVARYIFWLAADKRTLTAKKLREHLFKIELPELVEKIYSEYNKPNNQQEFEKIN